MNTLPDPHRSAAVIIGVGEYTYLPRLRAIAKNRERLKAALTNPEIWGLPDSRCVVVEDPRTSPQLIKPVIEAARKASDTLIVYYAGHGFLDRKGELCLTHPESENREPHTATPYDWLRQAILENSQARRKVVILDCCYSGRVLEGMSDPAADLPAAASLFGTYLLTSAAENVRALSPKNEDCTAFTGELTRVLHEGIPGGEEFLTLDTIYGRVLHSLRAKGRPEPQEQDRGQIGRLPFVRNRGEAPPPPTSRRRRGYLLGAVGLLLMAVAVPVTWWWATGDDQRSGRCSAHASLLGFSDALDKATYRGKRVAGLSLLAYSGRSRVLALSDNASPRLYDVALGGDDQLDAQIKNVTTLQRKDGTDYSDQEFDGEAMALEKGGNSVLVASEAGPSISRFDRRSGKLLAGIAVPGRFRAAPEGGADQNEIFESLALSPDGRHLYVGMESPLSGDGSRQGRYLVRILRYSGEPGGRYTPDGQFAYETSAGLRLADFVTTDDDQLLALERGYAEGQGNSIRIFQVSLEGRPDVSAVQSLADQPSSAFASKHLVFNLAACPARDAEAKQTQANPLLENAEGIALGGTLRAGEHKGRRALYLVSDDNSGARQITRFYAFAVALR